MYEFNNFTVTSEVRRTALLHLTLTIGMPLAYFAYLQISKESSLLGAAVSAEVMLATYGLIDLILPETYTFNDHVQASGHDE